MAIEEKLGKLLVYLKKQWVTFTYVGLLVIFLIGLALQGEDKAPNQPVSISGLKQVGSPKPLEVMETIKPKIAAISAYDQNYAFVPLDVPGSLLTTATHINNEGQVVGYFSDATGDIHGFVYSNGTYSILDAPRASQTLAFGINNKGQVVGYFIDSSGVSHNFVYSDRAYTILPNLPGASGEGVLGINDNRQVVANFGDAAGHQYGIIYSRDSFTPITVPGASDTTYVTAFNNSGQMVGWFTNTAGLHSFVYSDGIYTILNVPGTSKTFAVDINNKGQVAGVFTDTMGEHNFIYSDGTYTILPNLPGASDIFIKDINDNGQMAGTFKDATGGHVFVFSGSIYTLLNVPGASSYEVFSINKNGQVVGTFEDAMGKKVFVYCDGTYSILNVSGKSHISIKGFNDYGQMLVNFLDGTGFHEFVASPVPLPTSLAGTELQQENQQVQAQKREREPIDWEALESANEIILHPWLNPNNKRYCGNVLLDRIEKDGAIIGKLYYSPPTDMQPYTKILVNEGSIASSNLRFGASMYFAGIYIANNKYLTLIGDERIMPVFFAEEITSQKMPCGRSRQQISAIESTPQQQAAPTSRILPCPPKSEDRSRMTGEEYARARECDVQDYLRQQHGQ